MKNTKNIYDSAYTELSEQLCAKLNAMMAQEELWEASAKYAMKNITSLVEAGFTSEEAIDIYKARGPLVSGMD